MTNNSKTENVGNISFLEKHSVLIRIWHWLTFVVLVSSVICVLLASTILKPRENISMVQNQLKEKGITVTEDQAWAVAHEYGDKMWDMHKILGYVLSFLILSRIVIEFGQSKEEKLQMKVKNALFFYKRKDQNNKNTRHYLIVKYSYLLFYLLLLCMAITGLLLAFGYDIGVSKAIQHQIKEIHGFGQYLIYAFIFFHISGVIIADTGTSKGIVSGMINGG